MAAGDPYFNCDNTFLSVDQVIRRMTVLDGNDKPVISTNFAQTDFLLQEDNSRILQEDLSKIKII